MHCAALVQCNVAPLHAPVATHASAPGVSQQTCVPGVHVAVPHGTGEPLVLEPASPTCVTVASGADAPASSPVVVDVLASEDEVASPVSRTLPPQAVNSERGTARRRDRMCTRVSVCDEDKGITRSGAVEAEVEVEVEVEVAVSGAGGVASVNKEGVG